uniref:Glycosyltransferase 61 catalytic domain-containing protein n=1 Tax=viral metagenome TaxID=1070528 RepID=A0A6C0F528_9ZZZZ
MIKVSNKRSTGGSLFHYAHFLCDCLFPEIINNIFKYNEVIREKNIRQTIGNFSKIYKDVMIIKHREILPKKFNELKIGTLTYKNKEQYCTKMHFNKFRNFIFSRYKINHLEYKSDYPEVILIKRSDRVNLINDKYLSKLNTNPTTGKERREIDNIDNVEAYLTNKYGNAFKALFFENISFENQVLYFNNAKLIICAHGAVMSNMFFCKENTKIIEVTCKMHWNFFNKISSILNLNHIKCTTNEYNAVINCINENEI